MRKKCLGLCLVIAMIIVLVTLPVSASIIADGFCGANQQNLSWSLDDNGNLVISGNGDMDDYSSNNSPWRYYKSSIKNVTISYGVTNIGRNAFKNCDMITSIMIPNSVTSIEKYAFFGCISLISITIPDSVTIIKEGAFSECGFSSITIPKSVTSIRASMFSGCSSLESVTMSDNVLSIGSYAFAGCNSLTDITIPPSVVEIQTCAFADCSSLTDVTIPDQVTYMGTSVFIGCKHLTSIHVSEDNQNYSSQDGVVFNKDKTELVFCPNGKTDAYVIPDCVTSIGESAFKECVNLTSITISDSVISIGEDSFYGCDGLTTITIPEGVTSIINRTFGACKNLTTVTIPESVTSIKNYAFDECNSITDVYYGGTKNGWDNIEIELYNTALNNAIMHYYISSTANGNCGDDLIWTLDNGTLTITGTGNMTNWQNERQVPWDIYRDEISRFIINNGITSIGDYAFFMCNNYTSITLPESVTSIGLSAFAHCDKLKSITIPNGVTNIGTSAFVHCDKLTSVILPNSLIKIGDYAFADCISLTDVTIPDGVTSVGDGTIANCTQLAVISIPDSIISIGERVFKDCSNLTDIYYNGSESEWNNILISSNGNNALENAKIHYNNTYEISEPLDYEGKTHILPAGAILDITEDQNFRNGYVNAANGYIKAGDKKITGEDIYFDENGKIRLDDGAALKAEQDNHDGTTSQAFMAGKGNPQGIIKMILEVRGKVDDKDYTGRTITKEFDFSNYEIEGKGIVNFGLTVNKIPKPLELFLKEIK